MHLIGDYVKLDIPRRDIELYDKRRRIARYNGRVARVQRVVSSKYGVYYVLEGINADSGIPYSIPEDWVIA